MRLKSLLLLLTVITITVVGCSNETSNITDDNNAIKATEYIYIPEKVPFPENLRERLNINNTMFFKESFYFSTAGNSNSVYSMNINEREFFELPDYSLPVLQNGNAAGVIINGLLTDHYGFLWVIETASLGFGNRGVTSLRKLENTGVELLSLDISEHIADIGMTALKFNVDNKDNIYIGTDEEVIILDNTGRFLFNLNIRNFWNYQIIRMPDGVVAYFDGQGTIQKIDIEEHEWGETIRLPHNASRVFTGNNDFHILFISGMALYGVGIETDEIVQVLDFIDSDLIFDILLNIEILTDGRISAVTLTTREMLAPPEVEFIILSKVPSSERQERVQLTLAGINIDGTIMSAVAQFNRTNNTHRIHITDYSVFNISADDNAGLTRLTTEIITGRIPDILTLSELPFRQYAARGLFVDLDLFLDKDPELNREDFIESVLRAAETDGTLYQIFPAFKIYSIVGSPEIIGSDSGWTAEEFQAVLDANPEAEIPMGDGMSKMRFLHYSFANNVEQFLDWNLGVAHFDRGDFAKLLELANTFPMETDEDVFTGVGAGAEDIAAGRQIMAWRQLSDFDAYRFNRTLYGSEVVFKGFPGENRTSGIFNVESNVAISSQSENQQAAWEFVRLMLSEDFGRSNIHRSFPINKTVFDERLANAMIPDGRRITLFGGANVDIDEISVEESMQILALIDSISSVHELDVMAWNIISENASGFFYGRSTAQEAARIIQSRISIYMSEQR